MIFPSLSSLVFTGILTTTLLAGGTVIAFDAETKSLQVIQNGPVLVVEDRIEAVCSGQYNRTFPSNLDIVNTTGDIITPGFIDTHHHSWQTAYKTIASNTILAEYFDRYGEFAVTWEYSPEDVYISQLAGLHETMNAGTTDPGLAASIDSGARMFRCYTFHNVMNYTFPEHMDKFEEIANSGRFNGTATSLGIAYDEFNPGSLAQIQKVIELARKYKVSVITTHSFQGIWRASNSPEDLNAPGILSTAIPVAALGVDVRFTYSTDILTQARLWHQSTRLAFYRWVLQNWKIPAHNPMSVDQAILLATRKGGLALRRPDLGIIAVGTNADVVARDGSTPGMLGWDDPVAAIILHANVGDIKHVLVDDRFLATASKIQAIWKAKAYPVSEGEFPESGFAYSRVPLSNTQRGEGDEYGEQFL
ncbi:amidohydrolase family protein [Aspergillus aculeatinus CBS 121060]|uniref:Uncharacterized protein n=1 Tax=Aspergillus aculeatinus CBS 121060 TaxID=1448322 RepID=A0ACD1H749_9EURO|nr:hypothetical protein BO66DRAFT_452834 [Aspergillus aculeatinus CBS 121060]RAH69400.1 hypothetical protein BO66DRAFT_452834 [Aspergillus aculeatinus CBS 121060]